MASVVWKNTTEALEQSPYRLLVRSKWEVLFRPISAKSGTFYRGSNLGLLSWFSSAYPEKIPIFVTFEAAKKLVFTKPKDTPSTLAEFRKCISFSSKDIPKQHIKKGAKSAPLFIHLGDDEENRYLGYKRCNVFSISDIASENADEMVDVLNAMQRKHFEEIRVEPLTAQQYLTMLLRTARYATGGAFGKSTTGDREETAPALADISSLVNNTINVNLASVRHTPNVAMTPTELGTIVAYLFAFVREQVKIFDAPSENRPKKRQRIESADVSAVTAVLACEYIVGCLFAAADEEPTTSHCLYEPFVEIATTICTGYYWGQGVRFGLSDTSMQRAVTNAISVGNLFLDGAIETIVQQRRRFVACMQTSFPQIFGPIGLGPCCHIDELQTICRYAFPIPRPLPNFAKKDVQQDIDQLE